jgi:hypothetical protein
MTSKRCLSWAAAVGAIGVACAIGPSSVSAFAPGGNPCALTSSSQLKTILGFSKITVYDAEIGGMSPADPAGVTESYCVWFAWNGSAPKSKPAAIQSLRNGSLAVYAVDTYFPHSVAAARGPNWWTSTHMTNGKSGPPDFDFYAHEAPNLFAKFAASQLGRSLQVVKVAVPKLGASGAAGETGTLLKGVGAAGGEWWGDSPYSIIVIGVFDATGYPTAKQLTKIAKLAVPTFGL